MKKELIEEIKRIHTLTYGHQNINEQLGSIADIISKYLFGGGSDDDKKDTSKSSTSEPQKSSNYGIKDTLPKMSEKGTKLLNDPAFSKKLDDVCKNLGINRSWLVDIMMKESKMDPYITNPIGCVGLIQFCPDKPRGTTKKIGNKIVDLNGLKTQSPLVQLDLIEEYFKPYKNRISSKHDLYLVTFYPAALGKSDSHVIGGKTSYGLKVSKQNPAIARSAGKTPGQDFLTVGDVKRFVA